MITINRLDHLVLTVREPLATRRSISMNMATSLSRNQINRHRDRLICALSSRHRSTMHSII